MSQQAAHLARLERTDVFRDVFAIDVQRTAWGSLVGVINSRHLGLFMQDQSEVLFGGLCTCAYAHVRAWAACVRHQCSAHRVWLVIWCD